MQELDITGYTIQYNLMLSQMEIRKQRIQSIKTSMKSISLIHHNSMKIEAKQEKNKNRKQSLQLADTFTSQQLIRKFSEEDQEEERKNIDTFHQKYTILHKIGQGANALVESCQYKSTKKIYAVKIMTMDEQHILELKKNFLSIKQLRHPSIIKYHALYLDSEKHAAYLIMQQFPFPNLLQADIKQQGQLKNVFRQVLDAVRYIHDKNICHRDIKPENILYDAAQKRVKIIDFGISKKTYQRGARRDMLTIIGTSLYLAPQILCGGGYDERVDVWSIGVTLYRLIAGQTPFQSEYHSDTVNNIITGKVNFDPVIWGNYNFLAKDLVMRLLKDRNERLSAKIAVKHLWLNQEKSPKDKRNDSQQNSKFGKTESFNPKIYKAFNQQQGSNVINALSKEQGQKQSDYESPRIRSIAKRIHLMENKQFDLEDSSENEDYSPQLQKLKRMDSKLTKAKSN